MMGEQQQQKMFEKKPSGKRIDPNKRRYSPKERKLLGQVARSLGMSKSAHFGFPHFSTFKLSFPHFDISLRLRKKKDS